MNKLDAAQCPNCGCVTETDALVALHVAVHATPWGTYHGLNKLPFALMPSVAEVMEQYAVKKLKERDEQAGNKFHER